MEKLSNCLKQLTLEILPDALLSTNELSKRVPSTYKSPSQPLLDIDPDYNNYNRIDLDRAIDLAG